MSAMTESIVESAPVLPLTGPLPTNGGAAATYVSLRNCHKATLFVLLKQAVGHTTLITPKQATSVAGGSAKALSENVPIWYAEDIAVDARPARQTNAKNFTVGAGAKTMLVAFELDLSKFDVDGGFDCIGVITDDSSQATNFIAAWLQTTPRYGGVPSSQPSPIVD